METNPTTHKAYRLILGDYRYRGVLIIGKGTTTYYSVGRRCKNGNYAYRRFSTLKTACAYIDKNYDLFQEDV